MTVVSGNHTLVNISAVIEINTLISGHAITLEVARIVCTCHVRCARVDALNAFVHIFTHISVACVPGIARARERSKRVGAGRLGVTRVHGKLAFVNIVAVRHAIAREPGFARARKRSRKVGTFSILCA